MVKCKGTSAINGVKFCGSSCRTTLWLLIPRNHRTCWATFRRYCKSKRNSPVCKRISCSAQRRGPSNRFELKMMSQPFLWFFVDKFYTRFYPGSNFWYVQLNVKRLKIYKKISWVCNAEYLRCHWKCFAHVTGLNTGQPHGWWFLFDGYCSREGRDFLVD